MLFKKIPMFSLFFLLTIFAFNSRADEKAINGADNRTEMFKAPIAIQNLSPSIAGHFLKDSLSKRGNDYTVASGTIGEKHCSSVRFADQYIGPRCTGFLIAPNLIATAAHCMNEQGDCEKYFWIFDYQLKSSGDKSYTKIPTEKVYSCKKIYSIKYEYFNGLDYALVELDRAVLNRPLLAIDFFADTTAGLPIFMIGHPSGLPLKYTDGAAVTKDLEHAFETDLDIFGGNSGGPIFSVLTNQVVGIASRGHANWVTRPGATCKSEKVCTPKDNCNPTVVAKIKFIKDDLEKFQAEN